MLYFCSLQSHFYDLHFAKFGRDENSAMIKLHGCNVTDTELKVLQWLRDSGKNSIYQ